MSIATNVATRATETTLVISEVFGPTFQGEGPSLGQRAAFIRLGGCNLTCSWCDTPYTWDADRFDLRTELRRADVHDVARQVLAMRPALVVISGGEPLLQQRQPAWEVLLDLLDVAGLAVEVETNGTVMPTDATLAGVDRFSVSPKLAHGGDALERRWHPDVLRAFAASGRAVLKVVCQTPADVGAAASLAASVGWDLDRVYVMPEGTTVQAITAGHALLADATLTAGLSMTTRMHVLVWGSERGR